jgi:hypothetical protein
LDDAELGNIGTKLGNIGAELGDAVNAANTVNAKLVDTDDNRSRY